MLPKEFSYNGNIILKGVRLLRGGAFSYLMYHNEGNLRYCDNTKRGFCEGHVITRPGFIQKYCPDDVPLEFDFGEGV
ncbi:MAG: hypothetical protein M0Z67_10015 [Nitrospiraceae bacterium]|nr:hypothetical protein [Nitrospiraceae bacterium]